MKSYTKRERDQAAEPLIKLMCEEYHTRAVALVTPAGVEILEGICRESANDTYLMY